MANFYGTDIANTQLGGFVQYYGGAGEDYLKADINASGEVLYGGFGNDTIGTENATSTGYINAFGGDGNDWVFGGLGVDYLYGEIGNDFISGDDYDGSASVGSSDYIEGGQGQDWLLGNGGDDLIYGGDGNDSGAFNITAAGFNKVGTAGLYGGNGNDYLDGGDGNDYLDGGADNDFLTGGRGNDTMYGGAGNDTIYATAGNDTVFGGAGTDNIYGGRYVVTTDGMTAEGNAGNDFIFAGDNLDIIYGDNAAGTETGDDFIWAGGGGDYLIGGNGTDTLLGNTGTDYFYGGVGTDYFTLLYDINAGDVDYLLDFAAGADFVLLPFIASGNVTFGVSAGFAYGYIPLAGGASYLFLAAGATAAQLQAATLFV